ncbi:MULTISPECIES: MFS transporter [unclassified Paenibacillus]|uniref:CynX/NimT family MFS transporter n=1 Tax=unclassified Paenibacillus TaxID=185978 RepID=UPI000953EA72|nr:MULTISPECIES: MFS transporter [unclassified Paenibacillus]ASS66105.1 MFS transporter [Paenibacillus sp. RUD330]SIQ12416.1 MFS transporter, CP family, cyanate transporter [Paenibacillus sp. RU4X]SIQ34106.1 MFS transporter, CP family, cyanate transporter [Paenibacillus sp. RU4T]
MSHIPKPASGRSRLLTASAIAGILLIAANMRAAITSVGPVIDQIRASYGLSSEMSGLLTSLPLIAFAVMSLLAPRIADRFGAERSLLYGLLFLIAGMLLRTLPAAAGLFAGTALLGLAIALSNVLLPSIIKRDFPARIGILTGSYSVTMSIFAAIASGVSVPLASVPGWGWKGALLIWALLAAAALAVWIPYSRKAAPAAASYKAGSAPSMFRSSLAWRITFFMGIQSMTFYVTIAWLPAVFHENGMSASAAGWMLSLMQFVSLPTSFFMPVWASRMRSQVPLVLVSGALSLGGYSGLLFGSTGMTWLWITLLGLSQGATISLALTFFGLRTRNAGEAAKLSGMAQSLGYLLAALGPILFGSIHDLSGSWKPVLAILLGLSCIVILLGIGAARNRYVAAEENTSLPDRSGRLSNS